MVEDNIEGADVFPKYVDMPENYVDVVIGRVHSVNPVAGNVYFLRILLYNDYNRRKESFQDLLKLQNGQKCKPFKEVCYKLGLLAVD